LIIWWWLIFGSPGRMLVVTIVHWAGIHKVYTNIQISIRVTVSTNFDNVL